MRFLNIKPTYIALTIFLFYSCAVVPAKVNVNKELIKDAKVIAVMPFNYSKSDLGYDLGREMADRFSTELVEVQSFQVVERQNIERIFEEQTMSLSDLIDDESARKVGRLASADAVIIGDIPHYRAFELGGNLGESVDEMRLNVRLIDVETGKIIFSSNHFMNRSDLRGKEVMDQSAIKHAIVNRIVMGLRIELGEIPREKD